MIINIHGADTQLAKLIEKAEAGEEVIIARGGRHVARLTAFAASSRQEPKTVGDLPTWLGSLRGQVWIAPDIEETEANIAREMLDNPILPIVAPHS